MPNFIDISQQFNSNWLERLFRTTTQSTNISLTKNTHKHKSTMKFMLNHISFIITLLHDKKNINKQRRRLFIFFKMVNATILALSQLSRKKILTYTHNQKRQTKHFSTIFIQTNRKKVYSTNSPIVSALMVHRVKFSQTFSILLSFTHSLTSVPVTFCFLS